MAYRSPKEIGGMLWEGFNRARNSICHFLYVAPEIFRWLSQQRFRSKASRNMPHIVERYQELCLTSCMHTIIFPTCTQQACLKHSDSVRRRRNSSRYIQRDTCQGIPTQSRASLRQFLQIPQLSNESAPQSEQTLIKC